MEKKDIFISYKSEEQKHALWLRSILEAKGYSCWLDTSCIPGGSSYAEKIPTAIEECRIFIILLSQQSQSSIWVRKELDIALNCEKVIMPFMLEDCVLAKDFQFYLTNVQRYPAYENRLAALNKMLRDIDAILQESPQAPKQGSSRPQPRTSAPRKALPKLPGKKIGMAAAALILVALLAGLLPKVVSSIGLKRIDVFEDIHVVTEGLAPYASVSITSTSPDPFVQSIYFTATPDSGLKNGDTITITANVSQEDAREYGYRLASATMEYTLTDLCSAVTDVSQLLPQDVAALRERCEKAIENRSLGYVTLHLSDGTELEINEENLAVHMTGIRFAETGYTAVTTSLFDTVPTLILPFSLDISQMEFSWYQNEYYEEGLTLDFPDLHGWFTLSGLKLDPQGALVREGSFTLDMSGLYQDAARMEGELMKAFSGDGLTDGSFAPEN